MSDLYCHQIFYFQVELQYTIAHHQHGNSELNNNKERTEDKYDHNSYSRKLFGLNNNKDDWYVDFVG